MANASVQFAFGEIAFAHRRIQPLAGPQMAVEGEEMFKFSLDSLGNPNGL